MYAKEYIQPKSFIKLSPRNWDILSWIYLVLFLLEKTWLKTILIIFSGYDVSWKTDRPYHISTIYSSCHPMPYSLISHSHVSYPIIAPSNLDIVRNPIIRVIHIPFIISHVSYTIFIIPSFHIPIRTHIKTRNPQPSVGLLGGWPSHTPGAWHEIRWAAKTGAGGGGVKSEAISPLTHRI